MPMRFGADDSLSDARLHPEKWSDAIITWAQEIQSAVRSGSHRLGLVRVFGYNGDMTRGSKVGMR